MAPGARNFSANSGDLESRGRFIRLGLERSTGVVRLLATTAGRASGERIRSKLGRQECLSFSPFFFDRSMLSQDKERAGAGDADLPALDRAALVPPVARDGVRRSARASTRTAVPDIGDRRGSPAGEQHSFNRLAVVRRTFERRGLPQEVVGLLMEGSRKATHAAYESAWNSWCRWASGKHTDPLRSSLDGVLSYLTALHARGLAHATINLHRSMLSDMLPRIEGFPVGQHPTVVRLLRGCYNTNPPRPRYASTWDPKSVFDFAEQEGFNEFLSLRSLSLKTATLLALACFLRVSELASIDYASLELRRDAVSFNLSRPRKAQRSGSLRAFVVKRYPDPRCCPFVALRDYVDRTSPLRDQQSLLFVGLHKPHPVVTRSTLSRWIKTYLKSAGINTEVFSAHSTRGAAASKAVAEGTPIDALLRSADWSRESTFRKFYHREVLQNHPLKASEASPAIDRLLEDSRSESDEQS